MLCLFVFFFNDTATTEIYTLSLHDALPISLRFLPALHPAPAGSRRTGPARFREPFARLGRSEEHTSELQSRQYLVCRLLLEKKKPSDRSAHQTAAGRPPASASRSPTRPHCH